MDGMETSEEYDGPREPIRPGTLPSGTVLYRCPWCPVTVPVPPWKLEPKGDIRAGDVRIRITRAAWELTLLEHWRELHPERYAEFGQQVLAELGRDIEEAARQMLAHVAEVATVAVGETRPAASQMDPPPWARDRHRRSAAVLPPEYEEFMRGWSGLR